MIPQANGARRSFPSALRERRGSIGRLLIFRNRFSEVLFAGRWRLYFLNCADETISAAGQGLNVFGVLRGIAQHFANPGDGIVQAVVEIDEGVSRPELTPQLLASDEAASTLQQNPKNLDGLTLQAQLHATFPQLSRLEIQFERVETQDARR